MVEQSKRTFTSVRLLGYWGYLPGSESLVNGWNCANAFSYAFTFQSLGGDTSVGLEQAKTEALASPSAA